jgi:hypothetical protein
MQRATSNILSFATFASLAVGFACSSPGTTGPSSGSGSGSNTGTTSGASGGTMSGSGSAGTGTTSGTGTGTSSGGAGGSPCGAGASTTAVSYSKDLMPIIQANCSVGGTDITSALCHGASMVNMMGEAGGSRQYFGPPTPPTTATTTPSLTTIYNQFVTDPTTGKPLASTEDLAMDIVDPGDPTKSFLWYKINGTTATLDATNACGRGDLGVCGSAMPLPLMGSTITLLPQADRDLFCNWIVQGAKNN